MKVFPHLKSQHMYLRHFCLFVFMILQMSQSTMLAQNCGNISLNEINNPGPFSYLTLDQNDGLRNGPDYGDATVYYPVTTSAPFACVAIVPGFVSAQSSVAAWGPFLASHGIVSIIIDTNSPFDFPEDRADGLIDALETLRQENIRSASPLFGLIDTNRFAVMGWSMGGGGAQLAASLDPTIKAVIALCPWLSFPSSADLNHPVPVLILSGELDPTAPPNLHADVHYNLTPNTTDKLLFEVDNGNHSIANNPANATNEVGKYGLAWLRYHLLDDPCHCPLVTSPSAVTSNNLTNVVCPNALACPVEHTLFNNLIADGTYKAIETVRSASIVAQGGDVSVTAGQSIYLNSGFSVDSNASFEAIIGTCP